MKSLMILGRQPQLGLAELYSLYGVDATRPVGKYAAIVDVDPCNLDFDRLGGSVKFAKLLTEIDTTNFDKIEKYLAQTSPDHSKRMPEGKMRLGLSAYDLKITPSRLIACGLTLKRVIQKTGRSVRVVPPKSLEISSAQVIHNKLTGPNGWELLLIGDGDRTLIAQTVKVQDISDYTLRDRGRPKRDARVGMLPPKLAQIIINLASGMLDMEAAKSICDDPQTSSPHPPKLSSKVMLDPFCGSGVVLQEAALMGYQVYGTDKDPRMIEYSTQNMAWLASDRLLAPSCCRLDIADATNYTWHPPIDFVASETYLGLAFTSKPSPDILNKTSGDCNQIIKKFLANLYPQLVHGTRLCLAIPAWQVAPDEFKRLPLVDQITDLGYNRVSFEHAGADNPLLYYRADQIVARELIILTRR